MDKVIFVHDHKIAEYQDKFYSNGNFPPEVIKRYSKYANSFTFICRGQKYDSKPIGLTSTQIDNGNFVFLPNHKNLIFPRQRKLIYNKIEKTITDSDLVVIRLPSIYGLIVAEVCTKKKVKFVIEVVGNQFESLWYYGNIRGKILAPLLDFHMRKVIKRSKFTAYITENYLQSVYATEGKSFVTPNVYIKEYMPNTEVEEIASNLQERFKRNDLCVGIVGTFRGRYKGHHLLVEALNKLSKTTDKKITLKLLGDGNIKEFKKDNLIDESITVIHLGFLKHDEIFNFYQALDLLIQPSITEAQGRVIIEASSQGCLVLASEVGGIPEVLDSKSIFKKNNSDDIYNKILDVMKNPNLYKNVLIRNYNISRKFQADNINTARDRMFGEIFEIE